MVWLMFRILLSAGKEQMDFIRKLVEDPPSFPFSFNRYYNIENEPDHIQFRFAEENLEKATKYVESKTDVEKRLFEWIETNVMSTQSALTASRCALIFMRDYGTFYPPNTIVMQEFLHFFFDAIGQSYSSEEAIGRHIANFWQTRRKLRKSFKEDGTL